MAFPVALQAALWGWLAASTLLLGALVGFYWQLPRKALATVMAYGSGVLIAALCFELIPQAQRLGGLWPTLGGLLVGGLVFVLADEWLDYQERKHRSQLPGKAPLVGLLIAAGAFLDGIPESLGLGLGLLGGGQLSWVMMIAIALSNIPEGLASAAGLKAEGRSGGYVFLLWGAIVLLSGLAAAFGPLLMVDVSPLWLSFALGFSAGAVLCMLVDTLIPQAFAETHALTGLITLAGFMTAFALSNLL
jgi:zinc transporter, ZIP family